MNNFFELAGRRIGNNYNPLVIAEIGINHGGSLVTAKEMVDSAHRAGAELVKHQTHIVADEMSKEAKKIIPGNANISIYEIMERCALSEEDEWELMQYVQSKNMIFISTPFSRAAAERLHRFNVPGFKIGSGECNNYPLLDHIAGFGKPMIISTGMNTVESVKKAVETVRAHNVPFALMHTTNLYPTPPHLVRLGAMKQLMDTFPNVPVGLSDHSISNHACFAATAMGASLLERHFTDSMNRVGPDIICSMDEGACRELIEGSNLIHQMIGGKKEPANEEQVTMDFAFATVVSIKEIKAGEILCMDNIWVKRPGTGEIKAVDFNKLLGRVVNKNIALDQQLKWSDLN